MLRSANKQHSGVGTICEKDCWQVGVTGPCDEAGIQGLVNLISLLQRAGAAAFSVHYPSIHPSIHSSFLPNGVKLSCDYEEEMGPGSVYAPSAPQGPEEQVERKEEREVEGSHGLELAGLMF